ncbi:MAG: polysaccharide deacetylase family protein [Treponema sp.]|nr:polysaccharide deacetylase family protein [Treponema sp.]
MKKFFIFNFIFFAFAFISFAGIFFDNENLNEKDELLFTVTQKIPGSISYTSLFYAPIVDGAAKESPTSVTCFPEEMELYGNSVRIRNRYGVAFYDFDDKTLSWTHHEKSIPLNSMRLSPSVTSPNGEWNCYVKKTGYAKGVLVFEHSKTRKTVLLDENATFSYSSVPVKWSGDSSLLVYCKDEKLFFCTPSAVLSGLEIEEEYREIGRGNISSVCWAGNTLFYIDGDMIYKINVKELYTLGLYSKIIGKGSPAGRLPDKFDPRTDSFSVNVQHSELLLIKSGKIFSQFLLGDITSDYLRLRFSRPYMNTECSLLDSKVFWSSDGKPYIWMHLIPFTGDEPKSTVYKLSDSFVPIFSIANSRKPIASPDGSRVVFFTDAGALVYNVSDWKKLSELSGENFISAAWRGNKELYIGSDLFVRKWNVQENTSEILFASSAREGFWSKDGKQILVRAQNGSVFTLDENKNTWTLLEKNYSVEPKVIQNGRYRVFKNKTVNTLYENALYIRTLSGKATTKVVFQESIVKTPPRKKVALVFDSYESADGLSSVIQSLRTYNIVGTFFLNGEFIRRYPKETKMISATGNICASMFFSATDLTSSGFIADETFIRRGLARNEDEFFKCTGNELSLLWHAPFYKSTKAIKLFGKKAGYSYVESLGVVEPYYENRESALGAATIIESHLNVLAKNDGGVVPVVIGFPENARPECVYRNLDLLISAILDNGFDLVSVEEIVQ